MGLTKTQIVCFHSKKEILYTIIVKMGQVMKTRIDDIVLPKLTIGENILDYGGVGAMTIVLRIQMRVSMYVIVVCSSFFAIGHVIKRALLSRLMQD